MSPHQFATYHQEQKMEEYLEFFVYATIAAILGIFIGMMYLMYMVYKIVVNLSFIIRIINKENLDPNKLISYQPKKRDYTAQKEAQLRRWAKEKAAKQHQKG